MTITHELYVEVQSLLRIGSHEAAIVLLVTNGWERAEARRQVGAVAAEMRAEAAEKREARPPDRRKAGSQAEPVVGIEKE